MAKKSSAKKPTAACDCATGRLGRSTRKCPPKRLARECPQAVPSPSKTANCTWIGEGLRRVESDATQLTGRADQLKSDLTAADERPASAGALAYYTMRADALDQEAHMLLEQSNLLVKAAEENHC